MAFTTCMKLSDGFTQWKWIVGFVLSAVFSFACLNRSLATIPLGTAYAIWTGVGAFGTAVIGILAFQEPANFMRIAVLFVLIASIIGLKLVS